MKDETNEELFERLYEILKFYHGEPIRTVQINEVLGELKRRLDENDNDICKEP